jgi:hypothetical protein
MAMRSVLDHYPALWPADQLERLRPLLKKVPVLHHPEDRELYSKVAPEQVILVVRNVKMRDMMRLAQMGFEHIVQLEREDFPRELLASSLMVLRPDSFMTNPIPFFLTGFDSDTVVTNPDRHLIMRFTKQTEKVTLLEWLGVFLDRQPTTSAIHDICLQAADEMITNGLFNAPVRPGGRRAYKDLSRDSAIELPASQACSLFACFADDRVVLGCEDPFGSLDRSTLMTHLIEVVREGPIGVKYSTAGAGLGFKYLLENSANFYTLVTKGKRTVVACAFLLKGLKANLSANKHFHVSFR